MKYCDGCVYLNPREAAQTKDKEPHKCLVTGGKLYHAGCHPHIPRPDSCKFYIQVNYEELL